MTTPQSAADKVAAAIDSAFEDLAYRLDELSQSCGMKSDEMMRAVNAAGGFDRYYADWIQESWEGWEPIEAPDEVES